MHGLIRSGRTKHFLGISFVRGLIRPRMAHNFLKRSQGKMGKPRSSVELKKSNYIIRLFSGLQYLAISDFAEAGNPITPPGALFYGAGLLKPILANLGHFPHPTI